MLNDSNGNDEILTLCGADEEFSYFSRKNETLLLQICGCVTFRTWLVTQFEDWC